MRRDHHPQQGSSLFEVLVSVLILGVGMLGAVAVQTSALRHARHALEFSQATQLGQALLETMRSQRGNAWAGQVHSGLMCAGSAGDEIRHWVDDLQRALGETACGEVTCDTGTSWCKVSIHWGAASTNAGTSTRHDISIGARL